MGGIDDRLFPLMDTKPGKTVPFLQKRLYRLFRGELVYQDIEFSSKKLTLIGEGVFLEGGSLRLERRAATCRTWLGMAKVHKHRKRTIHNRKKAGSDNKSYKITVSGMQMISSVFSVKSIIT